MKEILRLNIREEYSLHLETCVGFIYNAPPNSRWYNPNFTRELEKEINGLRDKVYESRIFVDSICNIEGRQLIEFCERNTFDISNGKYEADSKG
jgi:hypothetical protein